MQKRCFAHDLAVFVPGIFLYSPVLYSDVSETDLSVLLQLNKYSKQYYSNVLTVKFCVIMFNIMKK